MEYTLLLRKIKDLQQEIRMYKRIIVNLKAKLNLARRTHRRNQRWPNSLKEKVILLRDKQEKGFAEISKILKMSNHDCRRLYSTSRHKR